MMEISHEFGFLKFTFPLEKDSTILVQYLNMHVGNSSL